MSADEEAMPWQRRRRTAALACLAQLYFTGVFFVAFPAALLWWSGRPFAVGLGALTTLGLLIVAAANVLVVALVADFVRSGRGTQVPIDPPRVMVVGGLYRWTRTPMYMAYVVTIVGEALVLRWWGMVVYALAFWLVFHAYVVWREEPLLQDRFGDAYRDYAATVPRWIPRLVTPVRNDLRSDTPPPAPG